MQGVKEAIELGTILGRHENALSEMVKYLESIDEKLSSICDCVHKHETDIQRLNDAVNRHEREREDTKGRVYTGKITLFIAIFMALLGFFIGHIAK